MRRWRQHMVGLVVAMTTVACPSIDGEPTEPAPDAAAIEAVDHVGDVLRAAGHDAPEISGLVGADCGPVDEFFGWRVSNRPVTLPSVPWSDVEEAARRGPHEGEGWEVRWAEADEATTPDGAAATVVTVVGGGEVDREAIDAWQADGLLGEVWPCG